MSEEKHRARGNPLSRAGAVLLGVLGLCTALAAQPAGQGQISVSSAIVPASGVDVVDLVVTLEADQPISGYSFGLDAAAPLLINELTSIVPLLDDNPFTALEILPGGGTATIGVLLSTTDPNIELVPGSYPVLLVGIDLTGLVSGTRSVSIQGGLGSPPVAIEIVGQGGMINVITLEPGSVTREPPPPPAEMGSRLWVPLPGQNGLLRIDPIAGMVVAGFTGVTDASAVAVDRTGVAWVAERGSGEVTRFVPVAGGGTAPQPPIAIGGAPSAITFDREGNAWVADEANNTLSKIAPGGTVLIGAGALQPAIDAGGTPIDLAVDRVNNLWVTTTNPNRLTKYSATGARVRRIPLSGVPTGLAVDRSGLVWSSIETANLVEVRTSAGDAFTEYTVTSPRALAFRVEPAVAAGGREIWVAGSGELLRIRPGASPTVDSYPASTTDPLSGVAVDGLRRVWSAVPSNGNLVRWDEVSDAVSIVLPAVGVTPNVIGDATGIVQADVLIPGEIDPDAFDDLDGDGIRNFVELENGSDPFDDSSVNPTNPEDVGPVSLLECASDSAIAQVSLSWRNEGLYDGIRIERQELPGGALVILESNLAGNVESYTDAGVLPGSYQYSVIPLIDNPTPPPATFEAPPQRCVATIGPGELRRKRTLAVGTTATNLADITAVPGAGTIHFLAVDSATEQVYALAEDFTVVSAIANPFTALGPPFRRPTGIAAKDAETFFLLGGGEGLPIKILELNFSGEVTQQWDPVNSLIPLVGETGGLAWSSGSERLVGMRFIGPLGCEVWSLIADPMGGATEIEPDLVFEHPVMGGSPVGLAIPDGAEYGDAGFIALVEPAGGGSALDADVEYQVTLYEVTAGLPQPVLDPIGEIAIPVLAQELSIAGFSIAGSTIDLIGITTSQVYGLRSFPVFDRGDVNEDAVLNIADPVFMLEALFGGGPAPSCADSGDVNDDGLFNIADPVSTLGHLFAGDPPPVAPFGACGIDLTQDALDCGTFLPCD